MANWPVGTVIVAQVVIIDYNGQGLPRIVARPGELGIVREHCGDPDSHEVEFSGGMFTSIIADPAIRLYEGAVSTVCDGQGGHPDQLAKFAAGWAGPPECTCRGMLQHAAPGAHYAGCPAAHDFEEVGGVQRCAKCWRHIDYAAEPCAPLPGHPDWRRP